MNVDNLRESEAIVIAELCRSGGALLDDIDLTSMDFVTNEAGWAFEAVHRLMGEGRPVDTVTVTEADPRTMNYIWSVSDRLGYNAAYHADLVHRAAIARRVEALGRGIGADLAQGMDVDAVIERARKHLDEAHGSRRQPLVFVGDLIDQVVADAERPRKVAPSPWGKLDDTLGGGFRPGALYTLAARPGLGKTAIALQIAAALADAGPVAFSSLEMPRDEIVRRIISQGAEMPHHLLEAGRPMPEVWKARIEAWQQIAPHSIALDDRGTVAMSDIRQFARTVRRPSGRIAGLVVDYLQLMTGPSGMSRYEIVTENTRQFKLLAKDLECPVIMLSQLNRGPETRMDKRPTLADLRDSGAIEQDSDVVMMLYRDPTWDPGPSPVPLPVPLELVVAKNRHGATMTHTLNWEGSQMRAF